MSGDADTVREALHAPNEHHGRYKTRDGGDCDCYIRSYAPALAALARLEARAAHRDALAEALRDCLRLAPGGIDDVPELQGPAWVLAWGLIRAYDAALAEAATREEAP